MYVNLFKRDFKFYNNILKKYLSIIILKKDCFKCIIEQKSLSKNSSSNFINENNKNSQTQFLRNNSNTIIETARSTQFLYKSQIEKNNNLFSIEKTKRKLTLPFEKQDDKNSFSEPVNTDFNQRSNLKIESSSGTKCCSDFEKKCIIF